MMVLVRDAAARNHPIIGLAALSSPPVQIHERDEWIGWDPSEFIGLIEEKPTQRVASWLVRTVETAIAEDRVRDLRNELDGRESSLKERRREREMLRDALAELEVQQARAGADLDHLGRECHQAVGMLAAEAAGGVEGPHHTEHHDVEACLDELCRVAVNAVRVDDGVPCGRAGPPRAAARDPAADPPQRQRPRHDEGEAVAGRRAAAA